MRRPYTVVLTGGIGSGKSAAAAHFSRLGAWVVDTDVISRELTAPAGEGMAAIVAAFGVGMRRPDGGLDRDAMRALIYADPAARQRLEDILHPLIWQEAECRLAAGRAPYAVLVVPLWVETGGRPGLADRVLVVDCDEAEQIRRTCLRDGLDASQARAILASQAGRAARLAVADDLLDNRGGPEQLRLGVEVLHRRYLAWAAENRAPEIARGGDDTAKSLDSVGRRAS